MLGAVEMADFESTARFLRERRVGGAKCKQQHAR
jgi:hypothetical protein